MKNKKTIKIVIGLVAFVVVAGLLLTAHYVFKERPDNPNVGLLENGSATFVGENVVIEVIDSTGKSTKYALTTHADYLKEVMDEADGLEYETADGMVMVINGERADYVQDGAYWAFYVNGDYCNYGIAEQPVNDGDIFVIEYTRA